MLRSILVTLSATFLLTLVYNVKPADGQKPARPGKRPAVVSGRINTRGFVLSVDRDLVQSWLPGGLYIDPESPYQDHPVIILFGAASDQARHKWITYRFPWEPFLEVLIGIPYLKIEADPGAGTVIHYIRAYLNSWPATKQGIRAVGWPKIYTRLEEDGWRYTVYSPEGPQIFTGITRFDQLAPLAQPSSSLRPVQEMLSQPLVLQRRGCFHLHDFDFHFECARIHSVPVEFEIYDCFLPGLGPLRGRLPGINEDPFGGFQIECIYTRSMLY